MARPQTVSQWLAACLLSTSLILAVVTPTMADGDDVPTVTKVDGVESSYGILMDAGSTSTKLHVYRWIKPSAPSTAPPRLTLVKRQRFKPGLGDLGLEYSDVESYIRGMVEVAEAEVPPREHGDTPIFLMATAGLRFLSTKTTLSLLASVRKALSTPSVSPFDFSKPSQVQVLSGEEEGAMAWIALNYLTDRLHGGNSTETLGVLEMGGGSTQIAFLPKLPLYSEEYQVHLWDQEYHLYTQSYLKFGSSAIADQVSHKLRKPKKGQSIGNPCMLKDDMKNVTLEDGTEVMQRGMGRPGKCQDILRRLLKPAKGINCHPKPCAIGGVYQPPVGNMTFYAVQSFTYAPETVGAIGEDKVLNITHLRIKAQEHCKLTLDEAESRGSDREFASKDCLMGLFIPSLLTTSYGFSEDTQDIMVTSSVNDQRIDWALGAMLVELSRRRLAKQQPSYMPTATCAPAGEEEEEISEDVELLAATKRGGENGVTCNRGRHDLLLLASFVIFTIFSLRYR